MGCNCSPFIEYGKMVASTDIKFYVNTNINAPQLSNAWGVMIPLLDACLVNGFGFQSVSTLTASGTTVTATFSASHNFMRYQVIEISGASESEYNGQHRIITVPNTTTITFELAATPSNNTATGTINCSLPPLGWEKYTGSVTGKAAFRGDNTDFTARWLRIIDSRDTAYNTAYAKYAKVGIVEDFGTDIDDMMGVQAPYDAGNPNKNWIATGSGTSVVNGWAKWDWARASGNGYFGANAIDNLETSSVAAGNRTWVIVGNKDTFYLIINPTMQSKFTNFGFGKYEAFFDTDVHNTFLACSLANVAASTNIVSHPTRGTSQGLMESNNGGSIILSRPVNGSASPSSGVASVDRLNSSGVSNVVASPETIGVKQFADIFLYANSCYRGKFPMIKWLYQQAPYTSLTPVDENGELFLPYTTYNSGSNGITTGMQMIKIGEL